LPPVTCPTPPRRFSILRHCRDHLAPQAIRRLEFAELPKTISGRSARVELRRAREAELRPPQDAARRVTGEFAEEDFPSEG